MGIPVVRPPAIRDREDLYQRDARDAIKALDSPGLRKVTIKGVVLTTTALAVSHQLGKRPVGWQVIDKNAQGDVWREGDSNKDTIPLRASATVTVDLVFW